MREVDRVDVVENCVGPIVEYSGRGRGSGAAPSEPSPAAAGGWFGNLETFAFTPRSYGPGVEEAQLFRLTSNTHEFNIMLHVTCTYYMYV